MKTMKTMKTTKKTSAHNDTTELFKIRVIAYYRVSTKQQKQSGLGLDAQKHAVKTWMATRNDTHELLLEFQEVESGKNNVRPILLEAIHQAKIHNAILLVAKLDRLSRNCAFIHTLLDSGIKVECCDMVQFNTLTIGLFALIAQHERETISKRTKEALARKKAQGCKLGNPRNFSKQEHAKAVEVIQNAAKNRLNQAFLTIQSLHGQGMNWTEIARQLNEHGFTSSRGKEFSGKTVKRVYDLFVHGKAEFQPTK